MPLGDGFSYGGLPRYFVLFEGDSITNDQSYPAPPASLKWPDQVVAHFTPAPEFSDFAADGNDMSSAQSRATSADAKYRSSRVSNVLIILMGRNDMGGTGHTASQFVADLKSYCQARQASGWKVIVCTVLPSTLSGFNALRNTANGLIRADTSFYDALSDLAADSVIGGDSVASDLTYFLDGTHPNVQGQIEVARVVTATLAAFWGLP